MSDEPIKKEETKKVEGVRAAEDENAPGEFTRVEVETTATATVSPSSRNKNLLIAAVVALAALVVILALVLYNRGPATQQGEAKATAEADEREESGGESGEVQLTPGAVAPASLELGVRADSLAETRDVFTPQQKGIINRELREIMLETNKYPEITFKSGRVH